MRGDQLARQWRVVRTIDAGPIAFPPDLLCFPLKSFASWRLCERHFHAETQRSQKRLFGFGLMFPVLQRIDGGLGALRRERNYVAAHLGVAKDSIYRWIEERGLPAQRAEELFRFKLSEVDNWVRAGSSGEAAGPPTVEKKANEQRKYHRPGRKIRRS